MDFLRQLINSFKPITVYASTIDTNNGTIGGAQILDLFSDEGFTYQFFSKSMIMSFKLYPLAKVGVCILLMLLGVMLVSKIMGIRSIFKGKAVSYEVEHINSIRHRDSFILRTNKTISAVTKFTKNKGFAISPEQKDYMKYNIERAGMKVPGGFRYYTPDEFDALCKLGFAMMFAFGIVLFVFMNMFIGCVVAVIGGFIFTSLPMQIVRMTVAEKDNEIRENFPNLYLMIHYELMSNSSAKLSDTLMSFTRITTSVETLRFVDDCLNLIETYGELVATTYISSQYREVPEVTRLMRLIKQHNEGADIKSELTGFREQIIKDKKYRIHQRMDKLVLKARLSFNLTLIILAQAVISAMAIYIPDLGVMNF